MEAALTWRLNNDYEAWILMKLSLGSRGNGRGPGFFRGSSSYCVPHSLFAFSSSCFLRLGLSFRVQA